MSLGIKCSAFPSLEHQLPLKFEVQIFFSFDMYSNSGYLGEKHAQEFGAGFFDMASASGYVGETYFEEFDSLSNPPTCAGGC